MSKNQQAIAKKNEGNAFFKNKQYEQAIQKYTEAINFDNTDVTFFSNRSACYAALEDWERAAEDGRQCVITDRSFVKGYYRAAFALQQMGNFEGAQDFVKRGLGVEPQNADLKRMSRELDESMRQRKVEAAISAAQSQMTTDISAAFKTVDAALRLDPTNSTLNSMMDRIRPKYEQAEKQRQAGLSGYERLKEQADQKYKNAEFENAIQLYTRALDMIRDNSNDVALKCLANRAACYKQLSNFEGTIADSTAVLEFKPDDVKSLIRRAQASEACERYKSALQDVRQVLAYGEATVGKATYDLANGMQHRLNRVIAQLKS